MATTYQESTSGTLPFYNTAVEDLFTAAQGAYNNGLTNPMPDKTLAGFSPLQQAAFDQTSAMTGAYAPMVGQAQQYINNAAQGAQFDPSQLQQYMNPYMSGVVDEIGRLGQEQFQQNIVPTISSAYGGLGQFGSARQGAMLANAAAGSQREILGQQSQALNTGYNNAMGAYQNWAGMNINANQQAGTQMGNLAQAQQNMQLGDIGALSSAGATQQAYNQQQQDLAGVNWAQQQQYPWQQLNQWASVFQVPTPQENTQWQTSFKKGGLAKFADGGVFRSQYDPLVDDVMAALLERSAMSSNINTGRRMADGGLFDWQISPETQNARDKKRLEILLHELSQNPDDLSLLSEITGMGVPLEDIVLQPQERQAQIGAQEPLLVAGGNNQDMLREALAQRREFAARAAASPELQARAQRSEGEKIGEAMLRAAAAGPANLGQLVGRSGAAYFDGETAFDKENQARAMARLNLEADGLPPLSKLGSALTSRSTGKYKSVRGVDGSQWMVNDTNPEDRKLISEGSYAKEINVMAERAARNSVADAVFPNSAEKAAEIARRTAQFRDQFASQFAQGGSREVPLSPQPVPGVEATNNPTDANVRRGTAQADVDGRGTIILNPQEEKEYGKVGEGMGNMFNMLQEGAMKSHDQLNQVDRLSGLVEGVSTGKLTPLGTELAAWAQAAGWTVDENLPNKEAFKSLSGQFALQLRNPSGGAGMPGAMSDKDLEFLRNMVPTLSNTPQGIKMMLESYRKVAERSIDVARLAREYRSKNPRKTLDEGFYDYLSTWAEEHPLFETAPAAQGATPAQGPKRIKILPEELR